MPDAVYLNRNSIRPFKNFFSTFGLKTKVRFKILYNKLKIFVTFRMLVANTSLTVHSKELQTIYPNVKKNSCTHVISEFRREEKITSFLLRGSMELKISQFKLYLVLYQLAKKFFFYTYCRENYTSLSYRAHLQFHSNSFIQSSKSPILTLLFMKNTRQKAATIASSSDSLADSVESRASFPV